MAEPAKQSPAQPVYILHRLLHPQADQRIAAAQVVIQKGQRRAHRETV